MIIHIANPIYDSVFKYLMEDERIAKTILSALLKKEVVSIEVRPHEYSNEVRDKISMFRIDFAANVREADGAEHLILVELQKTWLETETLRFRQYLGAQYSSKRNIQKDSREGFAIPMVTIYLLGHRVGDIEEPVLYVNHKSYDYDGNEVTKGIPNPFIESLVHNSIIVQIPLLHGQVNNRLEKVLSVFDQTKADADDPHVLSFDEKEYEGDDNLEYILRRLTQAASNADMRQDMNVEDEYYSAIENRDTAIMNRDKKIKEQDKRISEQGKQISEQGKQISEQGKQISEQGKQISEQGKQISEQGKQISEQNKQLSNQSKQLSEQNKQLSEQSKQLSEQSKQLSEQSKALTEKDTQIISLVKVLKAKDIPIGEISQLTGIDIEKLSTLLGFD